MRTLNEINNYEAPAMMCVECSVERGFGASNISDTEGHEIPDFVKQNEL
ncbi:MAG: hypothetical protein J6Q21_02735 [Alistipes sp.]|nr:hypothetical protein [Alistipes sp.]